MVLVLAVLKSGSHNISLYNDISHAKKDEDISSIIIYKDVVNNCQVNRYFDEFYGLSLKLQN